MTAMNRAMCWALGVVLSSACGRSPPRVQAPAPVDDDVSVGYGTQSKRDGTGATTSITPTESDAQLPRVEDLLSARVPGLEVIRLPNGSFTLRIRGQRTLRSTASSSDEPLLVIDDIPVQSGSLGSTLAGLVPRDVARIDVLKDAAATSIYGSRGANGVIIITTKRAR
jgi:TonB-dependent SusC/RagA subfamily outer membrane receptor